MFLFGFIGSFLPISRLFYPPVASALSAPEAPLSFGTATASASCCVRLCARRRGRRREKEMAVAANARQAEQNGTV